MKHQYILKYAGRTPKHLGIWKRFKRAILG